MLTCFISRAFAATGLYTGLTADTFKMSETTTIIAYTDRPLQEAEYGMSLGQVRAAAARRTLKASSLRREGAEAVAAREERRKALDAAEAGVAAEKTKEQMSEKEFLELSSEERARVTAEAAEQAREKTADWKTADWTKPSTNAAKAYPPPAAPPPGIPVAAIVVPAAVGVVALAALIAYCVKLRRRRAALRGRAGRLRRCQSIDTSSEYTENALQASPARTGLPFDAPSASAASAASAASGACLGPPVPPPLSQPIFVGLTSAVDHTPKPSGSAVGFKQRLHHPFETPFVSDPAELGASRYRVWLASQPLFHAWVASQLQGRTLVGGTEKKKRAKDAAHVRRLMQGW